MGEKETRKGNVGGSRVNPAHVKVMLKAGTDSVPFGVS